MRSRSVRPNHVVTRAIYIVTKEYKRITAWIFTSIASEQLIVIGEFDKGIFSFNGIELLGLTKPIAADFSPRFRYGCIELRTIYCNKKRN